MEKIDLTKCYEELDESIKKDDHTEALNISTKILNSYPNEKEAFKAKITALISLSKGEDLVKLLEETKEAETTYKLEYAYALYEKKDFSKAVSVLSKGEQTPQMKVLLAQCHNKMGNFSKSYELYKEIVQSKGNEIENETDLLSNYFAAYALSKAKDNEFLKPLCKYVASWECYYNYALICLMNGNYKDCFDTLKRSKEDFPNMDDEFNLLKNLHLNLFIVQTALDGFEINKYTDINAKYEKFFETSVKNEKMTPYFYNNYLNVKKDKDSVNETIKKIDTYLKSEDLYPKEKNILLKNKINFLIRGNKLTEANDALNEALKEKENTEDVDFLLMKTYLVYKNEKEKFDDIVSKATQPEPHLLAIQLMLGSINSKSYEQIHLKILNFVSQFRDFCLNYHFLSFFIGFYNAKKLKDYLKEFIRNFKNPQEIFDHIDNREKSQLLLVKIASSFYSIGQYEESSKFYDFVINKYDITDKEIQISLIQAMAHIDLNKSEEIRRKIDETPIDLSNEHMNSLLTELFLKFKKPAQQNKEKKKKKRKIRYPKNFDPKNPGLAPDPERWLPKLQRKKYRNLAKNKLAYQGAVADNKATTAKFK